MVQEGIDRAVVAPGGLVIDGKDDLREDLPEPLHLAIVNAFAHVAILLDEDMVHVEGEGLDPVLANDDGGIGLERVAHAQFVVRVFVRSREIGEDHVRIEQLFVHRHVNRPGVLDLVGPNAFQPSRHDRRLDDVVISHVEIEGPAGLEVRLLAKTHDHEACAFDSCGCSIFHRMNLMAKRP